MAIRRLVAPLMIVVACLSLSFARKQVAPRSSTASLAKPMNWGVFTTRIFPDSPRVTFSLTTSWIPGENHKGMFRYRIAAIPERTAPPDGTINVEETAILLKHVHSCLIFLNLYDADDFILRKIAVPFGQGVDEQVRLQSLNANEAEQMDATDYRSFVGGGSWNISWTGCSDVNK
jgi:hypothetical protein